MGGKHRKSPAKPIGMYGAAFGAVVSMAVALIPFATLPAAQSSLELANPPAGYLSPSPALTTSPEPSESQTRAPLTRSKKRANPSPSPSKRILLETSTEPSSRTSPTSPRPTTTKAPAKATTNPPLKSNSKCATIGLQPNALKGCNTILSQFPEITTVLGVGERASNPTSCHPKGYAIDLMVYTNKALGDRVYAYVKANQSALGAYPYAILWQVVDHFDHVHVSFLPCEG